MRRETIVLIEKTAIVIVIVITGTPRTRKRFVTGQWETMTAQILYTYIYVYASCAQVLASRRKLARISTDEGGRKLNDWEPVERRVGRGWKKRENNYAHGVWWVLRLLIICDETHSRVRTPENVFLPRSVYTQKRYAGICIYVDSASRVHRPQTGTQLIRPPSANGARIAAYSSTGRAPDGYVIRNTPSDDALLTHAHTRAHVLRTRIVMASALQLENINTPSPIPPITVARTYPYSMCA